MLNKDNIFQELFEAVPEIEEPFRILCEGHEISPSDDDDWIWRIGVMLYMDLMFEEFELFRETIQSVFGFFERMAEANEEVYALLMRGTMSFLYFASEHTEKAESMMLKKTREAWMEYQRFQEKMQLLQLSQLYSDEELSEMKLQ